jgi:hypothetical protein
MAAEQASEPRHDLLLYGMTRRDKRSRQKSWLSWSPVLVLLGYLQYDRWYS